MNRENQDNLPILKCLSLLKQHFSVVFSLIFGAYFYCFLARILSLKTKNSQPIIELR